MDTPTIEENNLLHQNWKTIIFKEKKQSNESKAKQNECKVKKINPEKKLEKKIEEGNLKHNKFNPEFVKKVIKYRTDNNLTQKQLANCLNIPQITIALLESNKAMYDHKLNNKLKRIIN
tara:strand:+ start:2318 stop:2674 length:357 start_codon:yes stop_codon:yes gene_type:complete